MIWGDEARTGKYDAVREASFFDEPLRHIGDAWSVYHRYRKLP